jgi:hypothetical protein
MAAQKLKVLIEQRWPRLCWSLLPAWLTPTVPSPLALGPAGITARRLQLTTNLMEQARLGSRTTPMSQATLMGQAIPKTSGDGLSSEGAF